MSAKFPWRGEGQGHFWPAVYTASVFHKRLSIYVFSYFPFGFEVMMWGLIVSVPDHCLPFYFVKSRQFYQIGHLSQPLPQVHFPMRLTLVRYGWCEVSNNRISWSRFGLFGGSALHLILNTGLLVKMRLMVLSCLVVSLPSVLVGSPTCNS